MPLSQTACHANPAGPPDLRRRFGAAQGRNAHEPTQRAIQSPVDHSRYDRQVLLPQIGPEGQRILASASVLLVGCGALGCVIADLLVRAGVGRLTLVDRDLVEATNLQRQSLYTEADADGLTPKATAAADRLHAVNSSVRIDPVIADLTGPTARGLLAKAEPDAILDGTDNFQTRFVLNDLAVEAGIPLVYGGVVGMEGTMLAVVPPRDGKPAGPCLTCLLGGIPEDPGGTCDTVGVFGPAVYQVAAWQAAQAIRLLLGELPEPGVVQLNAWTGSQRTTTLGRDPACVTCVQRRFDHLDHPQAASADLCGQNAVQVVPASPLSLDLPRIAERLAPAGPVATRAGLVRLSLAGAGDDGGDAMITLFRDGRAIVKGVRTGSRGRALYDRYIGG